MVNKLKEILRSNPYLVAIYVLITFCWIVVWPTGEFPLNDDWSYAKSIKNYLEKGYYDPGSWPAMTLVTHLVWGLLFVKVFGFSFLVLRASTWVSMLIGVGLFYHLLVKWSPSKKMAFFGTITLLFTPCYYNLSHTFMTDVNFLTLLFLSWKFAYDFFQQQRWSSFVAFFFTSFALVMMRQFGLIAPAGMIVCCLLLPRHKLGYTFSALVLTAAIILVLRSFEKYLHGILPPDASYKATGSINLFDYQFWYTVWYNITFRYKLLLIELLVYSFPLFVVFFPSFRRTHHKLLIVTLLAAVFYWVYQRYTGYPLQGGNIFLYRNVGPDTFFENATGPDVREPHTHHPAYMSSLTIFKYTYLTLSITALLLVAFRKLADLKNNGVKSPSLMSIFMIIVFFGYLFLLFISHVAFDRYHLPLLAVVIVYLCSRLPEYDPSFAWGIIPLLIVGYVAVAGTHDYFRTNEKRWEAYHEAVDKHKASHERVNGGFEVNCWNEGKPSQWYSYLYNAQMDYIIQYRVEDSFSVVKEYPYQRYFPFKKDTIRLTRRSIFAK